MKNLKNHLIFKRCLIYLGLFLFLLVWQWNGLITDLRGGYDMGVQNMELVVAFDDSLDFGKDLVNAIYAPLSWLYKGVIPALSTSYGQAIFQMLAINLFSAALRVLIIVLFWQRTNSLYSKIVAGIATVVVFVAFPVSWGSAQLDLCILAVSILIAHIHILLQENSNGNSISNGSSTIQEGAHKGNGLASTKRERKTVGILAILVGFLLSIPQLAKFSFFAVAMVLIFTLAIIFIVRKHYLETGLLIGTYGVTTLFFWVVNGEKIGLLFPYLRSMLAFTSDYTEFMGIPLGITYYPDFLFTIALYCIYGTTLIYLLIRNRYCFTLWFINAPYMFLCFKEIFVRADESHVEVYLSKLILWIICYLLFALKEMDGFGFNKIFEFNRFFWPSILTLLVMPVLLNKGWYPTSTIYADFYKMGSKEKFSATIEETKEQLRARSDYATLFEDVKKHPDKTLGMLSGEQTFFIAYDLLDRFRLSPIISLWYNDSSAAELAAAAQYRGDQAPDILFYHPEPLDGGYFVFHMGSILQSLLENYQAEYVNDAGYMVLQRGNQREDTAYALGKTKTVKIGEPIEIPQAEDAFVFMKVDWDLTLFGRLATFLLKPTQAQVEITTRDGYAKSYRFLRAAAKNGIYVSNLADGAAELTAVFEGDTLTNAIQEINFQGNKLFYDNEIEVSFFAVPLTEAQSVHQEVSIDFSSDIQPGGYQLFYAQDEAFNEAQSKWVSVGENQKRITFSIPREGWNSLRFDFPPTAGNSYDMVSLTSNGQSGKIDLFSDIKWKAEQTGYSIITGGNDPCIVFHLTN